MLPNKKKTDRDALLDELADAVRTWHKKEDEAIVNEIKFLDATMKRRSGAASMVASNTKKARVLVIDDITSFLAGT